MPNNEGFVCPSDSKRDCAGCPQEHSKNSKSGCAGMPTTPQGGFNALAADVHEVAVTHGWWDTPPSFPEVIALCHSELSKALEQYRNGEVPDVVNYHFDGCGDATKDECTGCFAFFGTPKCGLAKPDGVPIEFADCIIRILDYCAYAGIDIDAAIREKHEHNKTRPYRHGGKKI